MAATRGAVADFVATFLADVERRGQRYDCTQPEIYVQFTADAAAAMSKRHGLEVAPHDIEVAVRGTPALRDHAMLRRRVEYDTMSVVYEPSDRRQSIDSAATLMDAFRAGFGSLFAPPPAVRADPVEEAAARAEVVRCHAEVRAALERALTDGTYAATSSPNDGDWYVLVPIRYPVANAMSVEAALEVTYSRTEAERHRHRPFLEDLTRFNVRAALRVAPKREFCTVLYLRFPYDPTSTAL